MKVEQARYHLTSLKNRFVSLQVTEAVLIGLSVAMLVFTVSGFIIVSVTIKIGLAVFWGLLLFIAKILQKNLHRFNTFDLVQFVNARYPDFQESADLLLRNDEELTGLQLLQKQVVLKRFEQLYLSIKTPHRIGRAIAALIACSIIYAALSGFAITEENAIGVKEGDDQLEIKSANTDPKSTSIESLDITISPPVYTGLSPYKSKSLALNLPEGSRVIWLAQFSGQTEDAKIILSGRDSIRMKKMNNLSYTVNQTLTTSGFYQVQWRDYLNIQRSDYYKIDVIKDQPPKITINNLLQFTELTYTDKLNIELKSTLSDDYGLQDAQVIATVSKGSGEGVKFREEKIRFSTPQNIFGKQIIATTILNLKKLGLEPGDELYFYVEASDNKTPVANRNRTETYFLSLKDTAAYALTSDDGLGVDLMPEYFRSQRQIIIDTEKLLKLKKQITKQQFNVTSNELGYDQKALRLRYGQFLGEEEDSGIPDGTEAEEESTLDEEGKEKDPTKAFTHEHDTKNEHNLVAEKKNETHKNGAETSGKEGEEENPMKAFIHEHDNTEEATFFVQSIRSKLKAALSVMWDAELYLRLYEPDKSLPYQYTALNLLKEISNDSRIYVHRMGFDPPPLKEEKRLTADLSEIKTSTNGYSIEEEKSLPATREALSMMEGLMLQKELSLSSANRKTLSSAGDELALLATQDPGAYLISLSLIRKVMDSTQSSEDLKDLVLRLQRELWKALPPEPLSARKKSGTSHELDRKFLEQLEGMKHE